VWRQKRPIQLTLDGPCLGGQMDKKKKAAYVCGTALQYHLEDMQFQALD